jgi:cardiolipin synthase
VLFNDGNYLWAVIVLAISGLTDFFDGKIARKFNQISAMGKLLDPIADKMSQITIAIMFYLTFSNSSNETVKTFSWIFLVFLIKEAVMIVGGLIMLLLNIRPGAAEFWGKAATVVFYVGMVIIIAVGPEVGALNEILGFQLPDIVTGIIVVLCAIMTIAAFLSYMPETFRQFKEYFDNRKAKKN